jgi:hypothetical protein
MAIDTNIPEIKQPVNYIYTAKNLAINDISYTDGDGTLTVPKFDSYVMFDFDQIDLNGQKAEVDFSGMGDAYLCFVGNNIEVKIKNLNNIENVNKGLGQVVFKITSEDSRKIHGIQSKYFFITTKITQLNSSTEETVVYSGIWLKSGDSNRTTFAELIAVKERENVNLNEVYNNTYLSFEKQKEITSNTSSILDQEKNKTTLLKDSISKVQARIEETKRLSKFITGIPTVSKPAESVGTPDSNLISAVIESTPSTQDMVTVIDYKFFGDDGQSSAKIAKTKVLSGLSTLFSLVDTGISIPKGDLTADIKISSEQYEKYLATVQNTTKLKKYYSIEFTSNTLRLRINKKYKTDFLNILQIETLQASIDGYVTVQNINCFLKEGIDNIDEILTSSGQSQINIMK